MTSPEEATASQARRDGRLTIEHVRRTPRDPKALACPNCRQFDTIVLIERCEVEHELAEVLDVGVTLPELAGIDYTTAVILDERPRETIGLRCTYCRWGYRGPDPFARLVPWEP